MKVSDINSIIIEIEKDMEDTNSLWNTNKSEYIKQLKEKDTDLIEKYSSIFNILFSDNFNKTDMNRLKFMINMAKKVVDKNMTEHDASVAVGQRLVDDIVKPQLNKK